MKAGWESTTDYYSMKYCSVFEIFVPLQRFCALIAIYRQSCHVVVGKNRDDSRNHRDLGNPTTNTVSYMFKEIAFRSLKYIQAGLLRVTVRVVDQRAGLIYSRSLNRPLPTAHHQNSRFALTGCCRRSGLSRDARDKPYGRASRGFSAAYLLRGPCHP